MDYNLKVQDYNPSKYNFGGIFRIIIIPFTFLKF